jgi:hypothetical protein
VVGEVVGVTEEEGTKIDELLLLPEGEEDKVVPPLVVEGTEIEGLVVGISEVGEVLLRDEELQHRS